MRGIRYRRICNLTDDVRHRARGRWDQILAGLVPQIAEALARPGRHVTCPFHGGKGDFRVAKDVAEDGTCHCTCGHWDGFGMIQYAYSCSFPEAVAKIDAYLGGRGQDLPPVHTAPQHRVDPEHEASVQRKLQHYWSEAMPLEASESALARRYLAGRGLQGLGSIPDLRFHPKLPMHDAEHDRYTAYPALLAVARMADGRVATLHRTWLEPRGDAIKVVERRQYTSLQANPVVGGAIRLFEASGPALSLAEGIETALSARAIAPHIPVWSCLNKELLRAVRLPEHVRVVTVFADRDRSNGGQVAAGDLVDRLRKEGRKAMVFAPPFQIPDGKKGVDWNDVLQSLGTSAAREHFNVQRWKRQLDDAIAQVTGGTNARQQQQA